MEQENILITIEKFEELTKAKEQLCVLLRIAEREKYSVDRETFESVCGVKFNPFEEDDK